jgi:hypothetical protein
MTMTSSVNVAFSALLTSALDFSTPSSQTDISQHYPLTSGTGANQADRIWTDQRTLAASGTENLDLAGTALTDAFGVAITFVKIKAILIRAASGNTNDVLVGGHATAAFVNWVSDATDVIVVKPGGLFLLVAPSAAGYGVTATTGDLLKITNSAGTTGVTYDVAILGTSA